MSNQFPFTNFIFYFNPALSHIVTFPQEVCWWMRTSSHSLPFWKYLLWQVWFLSMMIKCLLRAVSCRICAIDQTHWSFGHLGEMRRKKFFLVSVCQMLSGTNLNSEGKTSCYVLPAVDMERRRKRYWRRKQWASKERKLPRKRISISDIFEWNLQFYQIYLMTIPNKPLS